MLLGISTLALALSLGSTVHAQMHSGSDSVSGNFNLTEWRRTSALQGPEVFSQALHILHTCLERPSCHRLAVGALLESCGSEPTVDANGNLVLEHEKDVFASRLAVCELKSANATIDAVCLGMIPAVGSTSNAADESSFLSWFSNSRTNAGNSKRTSKTIYDRSSSAEHDACIRFLYSSIQSWTSYSNARQNAAVLCMGVRTEVEKEEIADAHKAITVTSLGAMKELNRSVRLAQSYHDEVDHFKSTLAEEFGLALASVNSTITATLGNIAHSIDQHFVEVNGRFDKIQAQVGDGFQTVLTGIDGVKQVQVNTTATLNNTMTGLLGNAIEEAQKNQEFRDEVRAAINTKSLPMGTLNNLTTFTVTVWAVIMFMMYHLSMINSRAASCLCILLGFFLLCTLYEIDELATEVLQNFSELTNQIVSLPAETLKYIMLAIGSLMSSALILVCFKLKRGKPSQGGKSAKLDGITRDAVEASA